MNGNRFKFNGTKHSNSINLRYKSIVGICAYYALNFLPLEIIAVDDKGMGVMALYLQCLSKLPVTVDCHLKETVSEICTVYNDSHSCINT